MTFPTPELCTAKAETKTVLDVSVTVHYKIILLGNDTFVIKARTKMQMKVLFWLCRFLPVKLMSTRGIQIF